MAILEPNIRRISQVNLEGRPSLEDARACIGKKEKKQLTIPLALSQAGALETYDGRIATGAGRNNSQLPEKAGTFICLKIAENLLELQPVSDEEMQVRSF